MTNIHLKKGARKVRAEDFWKEPRKPEDFMSVEDARDEMDDWAAGINADFKAEHKT